MIYIARQNFSSVFFKRNEHFSNVKESRLCFRPFFLTQSEISNKLLRFIRQAPREY